MDGSNKKTNKQTKTHEHSSWTHMNTHGHPWAPEHAWAPMNTHEQWAPRNSHEFLWMFMEAACFQIKCSWQFTCWTTCLTVFKLLCLVFCYASFWRKLFFWTLLLCLCVMYFCFVLCWHCAPESNPLPLLQNMVFDTYITHTHIYIYVGVSQNEVSFFPLKATVLEPKKGHLILRHTQVRVCVCVHIYIYIQFIFCFLTCVFCFYPVLVCPIPKILYFFFCMWFDSLIVSEKNVSKQNMLHWKLHCRKKRRKKTKISKKEKGYLYLFYK